MVHIGQHVPYWAAATVAGAGYYYVMESSIPTGSNCSFSASPMTDFLAFVAGVVLIERGLHYDSKLVSSIGVAINVEHVFQLSHKQ